jgi:hypothetical protein
VRSIVAAHGRGDYTSSEWAHPDIVIARAKKSGIELDATQTRTAALWQVRDGKVIRHVVYLDRADALADLGLEE